MRVYAIQVKGILSVSVKQQLRQQRWETLVEEGGNANREIRFMKELAGVPGMPDKPAVTDPRKGA
jgi:hypothetical protein